MNILHDDKYDFYCCCLTFQLCIVSINDSQSVVAFRQDDILCIGHCHPNLIATGSFDGDLILWSLERQNVFKRLKRGAGSLL